MQPVIYSVVFFRINNSWPLIPLKGTWHLLIFQQCVLSRSITTCLSGIHSYIVTYLVHPRFKHKGIEFSPSLGYDEDWDWPLIVSWDFQGPNLEGFSSLLVLGSENSISPLRTMKGCLHLTFPDFALGGGTLGEKCVWFSDWSSLFIHVWLAFFSGEPAEQEVGCFLESKGRGVHVPPWQGARILHT